MSYYRKLLEEAGALLQGHFLLTSGMHSDRYVEKIRILENPKLLAPFVKRMIELSPETDWFVGPTLGGAIIAYELARATGKKCAFAERNEDGEGRSLKRDFGITGMDKIVVVDDVLTTGLSVVETCTAIKKGKILAIVVLVDRSMEPLDIDIPIKSVVRYPTRIYYPDECYLCMNKIKLTKRGGSGRWQDLRI
ncbi:MAG: phosphoribosyltransferase family protein [candidate division WOR-3 bacterium]